MFKKLLIIFIIVIFVFLANKAEADFLRLNLSFDNGKIGWGGLVVNGITSENIRFIKGLNFVNPQEGDYEIAVQSFKGVILQKFKAELKPSICYDSIDPETQKLTGGCEELEKGATGVDIPYYSNGYLANIFDASGKLVFSANLSTFATCNENGACESNLKENKENCPTDCFKSFPWFLIIIIGLVVLLLVVITLIIKNYFRKK